MNDQPRTMDREGTTRFVILCFPRTGSYMLVDLLNAHAGVTCHGELFKDQWVELKPEYLEKLGFGSKDMKRRDDDAVRFYESVYALTPDRITGFKIFPNHSQNAIRGVLLDRSIRKIFLARNPVQSLISLKMAQKTDIWVDRRGNRGPSSATFRVHPYELVSHICRQKEFYDRCRTICAFNESPFLFVDYQDLTIPKRLQAIAAFLGLPAWNDAATTTLHKQIQAEYPSIVENWPAVARLMRQTRTNIDQGFREFTTTFVAVRDGAARVRRHPVAVM